MRHYLLFILPFLIIISLSCNERSKEIKPKSYEFAFQDTSLTIEARVNDLISRLTMEEKIYQLFNDAPAIERLGIASYNWWNEALHGVARAGNATVFPQAIALASTWDEQLMLSVASAISDEARAKHHDFVKKGVRDIYTGLTFWSPNINIFRDPRWGRGQETYGEDPYLTGRMAVNFINGLQGDDPKYLKSIATAKHYAVHNGPEESRHRDNFDVSERDLHETYLAAFKMTVKEANVQSVMCAYNRFRDVPCCGSGLLLQEILRDQYGFEGYVVTDCGAVSDFFEEGRHDYAETASEAWAMALAAGTDLNCENNATFIKDNPLKAIKEGIIDSADVDRSLTRLFTARFKLGLFDPLEGQDFAQIPISIVGSEAHKKLALKAAEKSMVLLKNDGILPLKGSAKIALIGPNANNQDILIGNYNGTPIDPVSPLKAFNQRYPDGRIKYAQGCQLAEGIFGSMESIPENTLFHLKAGKLLPGLEASYYSNTRFEGDPGLVRIENKFSQGWETNPVSGVLNEAFSVKWSGILVPKIKGEYRFGGNVSVKINGIEYTSESVEFEIGKRYTIEAEYALNRNWWNNLLSQEADLNWMNVSRNLKEEALQIAQSSEVIVFCGGISPRLEGEEMSMKLEGFANGDRTDLELPKAQKELLKELKKLGLPIIYINFSGSAIALNWEKENANAIIQAFYPGESTGTALTNLLYGDSNPSGRLPVTFYKSSSQLPDFLSYAMKGRTYKYFEGEVLYPFGHGESYTSFSYSDLKVSEDLSIAKDIFIECTIANTGDFDGREVVQVYLSNKDASVPVAQSKLVAFKSIYLKKGVSSRVRFKLSPEAFSIIDKEGNRVIEGGKFLIHIGGGVMGSEFLSADEFKEVNIELLGDAEVLER